MSDSLQPYALYPARRLCAWNSIGKNTGVGCHFLLQGILPTQGSNLGLRHYRPLSEPPRKSKANFKRKQNLSPKGISLLFLFKKIIRISYSYNILISSYHNYWRCNGWVLQLREEWWQKEDLRHVLSSLPTPKWCELNGTYVILAAYSAHG